MIKLSKVGAACACVLLGWLGSCAPAGEGSESLDTESVEVALTAIPAATRCVRFTAFSGAREYTQAFDVTGLTSLTAQVRGLPSSQALSMTADAFAVACTAVTPTTQATWLTSLPVAVTITPGVVPTVSFVLRPAAGVNGDVEFLFLAATPSSRAYPAVVVGQASAQVFTIQNIGPAATGALAASLTGTGASQFTIGANTCTAALAASATCSITASFVPTAAGAKAATLVITGAPGGTIGMPLSGTGLQPAVLALTPATQDYGSVGVGKSSAAVTYTVTNTGGPTTAAVDVTSSDATFAISASTCGVVLTQAQTCTFKVTFSPVAIAAKTATLTTTAGAVTATATATGTGVAVPALTLTPSALNFGTVIAGNTAQIPVTVKNVGGFPLSAISVFVGGTSSGPFVVDGTGCPGTLAPNATCSFFVNVAAPDPGVATRAYNSTVLVTAGGANPASVMGTAATTISWPFVPNPTSFFFTGVKAGTTSSVNVTFTNVSGVSLPPFSFALPGPVFTIASSTCGNGFGLAAGGVCTVVVRYNAPPTAGVMSIDVLSAKPIPGVGPNGVTVAIRGTSQP